MMQKKTKMVAYPKQSDSGIEFRLQIRISYDNIFTFASVNFERWAIEQAKLIKWNSQLNCDQICNNKGASTERHYGIKMQKACLI